MLMEELFTSCGKEEFVQTVRTQILALAWVNIVISSTFNMLFAIEIPMER